MAEDNSGVWHLSIVAVVAIVAVVVMVSQTSNLGSNSLTLSDENSGTGYVSASQAFTPGPSTPPQTPMSIRQNRAQCTQRCPNIRQWYTTGKTPRDAMNNQTAKSCYTNCGVYYDCFVDTVWTNSCMRNEGNYTLCVSNVLNNPDRCKVPPRTPPRPSCVDGDGNNASVKGKVTSQGRVYVDVCETNGRYLTEQVCSGGVAKNQTVSCQYGCQDGRCLPQNPQKPYDQMILCPDAPSPLVSAVLLNVLGIKGSQTYPIGTTFSLTVHGSDTQRNCRFPSTSYNWFFGKDVGGVDPAPAEVQGSTRTWDTFIGQNTDSATIVTATGPEYEGSDYAGGSTERLKAGKYQVTVIYTGSMSGSVPAGTRPGIVKIPFNLTG